MSAMSRGMRPMLSKTAAAMIKPISSGFVESRTIEMMPPASRTRVWSAAASKAGRGRIHTYAEGQERVPCRTRWVSPVLDEHEGCQREHGDVEDHLGDAHGKMSVDHCE